MLNNEEETPIQTFKGYSLFVEIEDFALRARNRAVIMANIFEEHYNSALGKVSALGLKNILEYFKEVPDLDKAQAFAAFNTILQERGIKQ